MARLIDSSVFVGMERRGMGVETIPILMPPGEEVAQAAISVSELLVGVLRADTPTRRLRREAFYDAILERVPVIPFDLRVARTHARLSVDLFRSGQRIGAHDLLIAATALVYGYSVLTDNPREFGRVPGLVVHRPTWPG